MNLAGHRRLARFGLLACAWAWGIGPVFIGPVFVGPVFADGSSMGHGEGGPLAVYAPIIRHYNATKERFRIEGLCQSACTMFLGIRNVCVERSAELRFHAGHDIEANVTGPDTLASRRMLATYNDKLRDYLVAGHHMDTGKLFTVTGADLIDRFGYPECPLN